MLFACCDTDSTGVISPSTGHRSNIDSVSHVLTMFFSLRILYFFQSTERFCRSEFPNDLQRWSEWSHHTLQVRSGVMCVTVFAFLFLWHTFVSLCPLDHYQKPTGPSRRMRFTWLTLELNMCKRDDDDDYRYYYYIRHFGQTAVLSRFTLSPLCLLIKRLETL